MSSLTEERFVLPGELSATEPPEERGLARDEVRLLVELDAGAADVPVVLAESVRVDLGIRIEIVPVPARSLPRYELKARRLVRR